MKNKTSAILALTFIIAAALGCSKFSTSDDTDVANGQPAVENRSIQDRAIDAAVGDEKTGIAECDEVLEAVKTELNSVDDDIVTKAVKATVLNRIREGIRESIRKKGSSKTELAKACSDFKAQFNRFKANEGSEKSK